MTDREELIERLATKMEGRQIPSLIEAMDVAEFVLDLLDAEFRLCGPGAQRDAFMAGAQWRRPLTWASDAQRAEAEALRRWPEPAPERPDTGSEADA